MRDARYVIGFLITVGLLILLIVLLLSGGSGGGNNKTTAKVPTTSDQLIAYSNTDAVTRLTVDGPINAADQHRQQQISVGRDQATYEELKGYQGQVTNTKTYTNSQAAYDAFLHALARAGFTKVNNDSQLQDERGYCPEGERYIFELMQNNKDVLRSWTSSCGRPKTYQGSTNLTLDLFRSQIPDYQDLTNNSNFDFSL